MQGFAINFLYMKWLPTVLIVVFMLFGDYSFSQEIAWQNTLHWKLYDIHGKKGFDYSPDTLQYFKNIPLADTEMHKFLTKAAIWPPEKYGLWMGLFVASYETLDNRPRKIIISSYGGFFYDSLTMRYYELPEEIRSDWQRFIIENADKIK
jgi:hypothetical protein